MNKPFVYGYDPEDRRKHLEFIQAIIARMSAASANVKGWLLPVVTAAYGYALTKHSPSVAILGMAASAMFAFIDAHYLDEERKYRQLYNAVADGKQQIPPFSLKPLQASQPQPDHQDSALPSGKLQRLLKWTKKIVQCIRRKVKSWLPEKDVCCSWSIFPFYMAIIFVGILILLAIYFNIFACN
jgi:hypothetical protein